MDELLPILDEADLIVYAFPLYIYSVPGPVKTFMDRQLPLVEGYMIETEGVTAHPRRNKDKNLKAFILSVAGFPETSHFDAMIATFKQTFRPTSERYLGEIIIAGANSMAYDQNQPRYAQLYTLIEQAGYELAQYNRVRDSTLKRIDDLTYYPPEKIKAFQRAANQYWDSFLEKDSNQSAITTTNAQPLHISDGGTGAFFAGMASQYNPRAIPGVKGVLQFQFDTGSYYVVIDGEHCSAYAGTHPQPTTTINSPEAVWMKIARGELSGQTAFMEGLYIVEGDMKLLLNMNKLFN
jgi:putative NADPH-quinone reductase